MRQLTYIFLTLVICVLSCESRKNVLFIVSDDLRPEIAAMYDKGNPYQMHDKMYTPHLDAFAERSAVFRKAYVQQAICGPSRASFMTGRRPDTTHVYNLDDYFRTVGGDFTTIPQYFKQQGYRTLGMGKIFHGGSASGGNYDKVSWSDDEEFFTSPSDKKYWRKRFKMRSWAVVNKTMEEEHPLGDQEITDHAIKSLRRLAPTAKLGLENFFMAVGFRLPHLPFVFPGRFLKYYPKETMKMPSNPYAPKDMPEYAWHGNGEIRNGYADITLRGFSKEPNTKWPEYLVKNLRRAYYASVSYVDSLFGKIMAELDRLGLRDDTIVMFGSDHGYELYEHSAWCKHTNFEIATRTPLMIRAPGVTDKGVMSDHLVEYTDVYSTLVELAGLPALPTCPKDSSKVKACTEGTSLVPVMKNPNLPGKQSVFMQYPRNRGPRIGTIMGYSMRTERYRYTEWVKFNGKPDFTPNWFLLFASELYDHYVDPDENVNRAGVQAYASVKAQLSKTLHAGWRAQLPS
ncbi:unnamed protein product [Owenia fusiformis]|uniref:Uncharacterized protein n=1 Tax=Owenia fusiformis TaxID=6347 RepID=A0A8J1U7V3_OWEFU|nr:unnamed protein product [Owenia fusiformis]